MEDMDFRKFFATASSSTSPTTLLEQSSSQKEVDDSKEKIAEKGACASTRPNFQDQPFQPHDVSCIPVQILPNRKFWSFNNSGSNIFLDFILIRASAVHSVTPVGTLLMKNSPKLPAVQKTHLSQRGFGTGKRLQKNSDNTNDQTHIGLPLKIWNVAEVNLVSMCSWAANC